MHRPTKNWVGLRAVDPEMIFPGRINYQFDLVKRSDDTKMITRCISDVLYGSVSNENLVFHNILQYTLQDYVLKVKIWVDKTFSDFVKDPASLKAAMSGGSFED
jgi:hypothetical protein